MKTSRVQARRIRHKRVRKKVSGSDTRPRMAIALSNRHMSVQFIDDGKGVTLGCVTTLGREMGHNADSARELGREAAEKALQSGIDRVVVDRGGHKYHGRVRALVEAAAKAGLLVGKAVAGSPGEAGEGAAAAGGGSAGSRDKEAK
ncbi:50S ribosomal protein L18 [Verrucomicrobiota bacterium]